MTRNQESLPEGLGAISDGEVVNGASALSGSVGDGGQNGLKSTVEGSTGRVERGFCHPLRISPNQLTMGREKLTNDLVLSLQKGKDEGILTGESGTVGHRASRIKA